MTKPIDYNPSLLAQWFCSRDTGISSQFIAGIMAGVDPDNLEYGHPWDPADFGRCARLLHIFPQWKERLSEMSRHSEVWQRLILHWDEIHSMMDEEVGIDWSKGRSAPKTYNFMKTVLSGHAVEAA